MTLTEQHALWRQGLPTVSCSTIFCHNLLCLLMKEENVQNYNLADVLDGCETWSRILREEYVLRVRHLVLRRTRWQGSEENGPMRSLRSALLIKCYSGDQTKRVRRSERVGRENINVYRAFVGKDDIKKPLGRTRRRWEDNIKTHLKEIIRLSWLFFHGRDKWMAFVNVAMKLRVP